VTAGHTAFLEALMQKFDALNPEQSPFPIYAGLGRHIRRAGIKAGFFVIRVCDFDADPAFIGYGNVDTSSQIT
jgi:hypothetical protein